MSTINPIQTLKDGWKHQFSQILEQKERWIAIPSSHIGVRINANVLINITSRIIASLAATVLLSVGTFFAVTNSLLNHLIVSLSPLNSASRLTKIAATTLLLPLILPSMLSQLAAMPFNSSGAYIFNQLKRPTPPLPPTPSLPANAPQSHIPLPV